MRSADAAKWVILGIVAAAAASGVYLTYEQTRPCANPIHFSIGAVDPSFGETNAALLKEAEAAAAIWNKAAGKTVVAYSADAPLTINLIYDSRQANATLGESLARTQDTLDTRRAALDALEAQFESRQAAYNTEVDAVNARGGATRKEAASLNAERASLEAFANSLRSQTAGYNASVDAFNAQVANFNQTAGGTFREGEYIADASGKRIEIYEFIGATQLERVLAHELGHALGLEHNSDPASIMYAKNESGNLTPTAADLAALKTLCG